MHIHLITEYLYLWDNDLTGTFLTELGLLSNLEGLVLSGNQLSGSMPTSLASLSLLSKSQSLLLQCKIQFLYYGFSCLHAHPPHYRAAEPQCQ